MSQDQETPATGEVVGVRGTGVNIALAGGVAAVATVLVLAILSSVGAAPRVMARAFASKNPGGPWKEVASFPSGEAADEAFVKLVVTNSGNVPLTSVSVSAPALGVQRMSVVDQLLPGHSAEHLAEEPVAVDSSAANRVVAEGQHGGRRVTSADVPSDLRLGLGYVRDVFFRRSSVQYVTAFCFFWGLAILALKAGRIRAENGAFLLGLLPVEEGQFIRREDAVQCIRRLKRLPPVDRSRLLTSRVWRALTRFNLLGSAEKVDDLLKYQGETDAENMESSFSFLKFLIAIVPILGFLGTVLGISAAVSGFSGIVSQTEELSEVKTALSGVTDGLATAFDTTLVALILSALLMFGLTLFQAAEERLLGRIDGYCLEYLLDRFWVPPAHEQMAEAVSRAMASLPERIAEELARGGKRGERER